MSIASEISRLQTAKADLKTSIEGKGVTVPSSAKLDDYPDLVDAIQSGSIPDLIELAKEIILVRSHSYIQSVSIEAPNCDVFYGSSCTYIDNLQLSIKENAYVKFGSGNLQTISFDKTVCINVNYAFAFDTKLKKIDGIIDLSNTSANATFNMFANCFFLEDVRFTKSPLKVQPSSTIFANARSLSDDSIASIANALDETQTGYSIKLDDTPKAKCSTLMGNNNNGTFEIDANGNMSCADFITNIKGWTLA